MKVWLACKAAHRKESKCESYNESVANVVKLLVEKNHM